MIDLRTSLYYHLHSNHFPPIDPVFIDTAIWAIGKVNDWEGGSTIVMPNGIEKSAWDIVGELHLSFYIGSYDDEDTSFYDEEPEVPSGGPF